MARIQTNTPRLTPGNVVFLYGVLRDALGVGKQTFITHVEAALAEKRLTADDLGFDTTQVLLEALGDCIKLTIFKGGRLYATVVAQPDWDAALEAAAKKTEQKPASKGNKPWKRKKGDKAIKPSCPKRVKREPEPKAGVECDEAASNVESAADEDASTPAQAGSSIRETAASASSSSIDADAAPAAAARPTEAAPKSDAQAHRLRNANFSLEDDRGHEAPADAPETDTQMDAPGTDDATDTATIDEAVAEPSIAVTVVYDPYTGIDEETVITPTPGTHVPAQPDVFIGQAAMCLPPAHAPSPCRASGPEAAPAATKDASPASSTSSVRTEKHGGKSQGQASNEASTENAPEMMSAAPAAAHAPASAAACAQVTASTTEVGATSRPQSSVAATRDAYDAQSSPAKESTCERPSAAVSDAAALPQAELQAAESAPQHGSPHVEAPVASMAAPATTPPQPEAIQATDASDARAAVMQESATVRPSLPDDLPVDFTTDVYCPGQQLHQLTLLYPFGADVLGIVGEYFHIACDRGDIEASRRRASFSIRYLDHRERKEALVRITRRAQADNGPLWSISAVEVPEES